MENKYESVSAWFKMSTRVNQILKEQLSYVKNQTRKSFQRVAGFLEIQNLKDFQDEIDRESFSLFALREREPLYSNPTQNDQFITTFEQSYDTSSSINVSQRPPAATIVMPGTSSHLSDRKAMLKAVKIACLNYQSSQIPLPNGDKINRKQAHLSQQNHLTCLQRDIEEQYSKQIEIEDELVQVEKIKVSRFEIDQFMLSPRFVQEDVSNSFNKIVPGSENKKKQEVFGEQ